MNKHPLLISEQWKNALSRTALARQKYFNENVSLEKDPFLHTAYGLTVQDMKTSEGLSPIFTSVQRFFVNKNNQCPFCVNTFPDILSLFKHMGTSYESSECYRKILWTDVVACPGGRRWCIVPKAVLLGGFHNVRRCASET